MGIFVAENSVYKFSFVVRTLFSGHAGGNRWWVWVPGSTARCLQRVQERKEPKADSQLRFSENVKAKLEKPSSVKRMDTTRPAGLAGVYTKQNWRIWESSLEDSWQGPFGLSWDPYGLRWRGPLSSLCLWSILTHTTSNLGPR